MIDLYSTSSLPIQFDFCKSGFVFQECVSCRNQIKVSLANLIPALLNKSLRYPEVVYEENEDMYSIEDAEMFDKHTLHYDIVALPAGLLGIEYIKTHIYYTPENKGKIATYVECLYGILTVLIQKNEPKDELDFDTSINEGIMIKLRKGEKIAIPTGYYYTFINTRNTPAIFSRAYKDKGTIDYKALGHEQGLGYFAIRKNARAEIVFNPKYRYVPKIKKYTPSDDRFRPKFTRSPLYQSLRSELKFFMENIAGV